MYAVMRPNETMMTVYIVADLNESQSAPVLRARKTRNAPCRPVPESKEEAHDCAKRVSRSLLEARTLDELRRAM